MCTLIAKHASLGSNFVLLFMILYLLVQEHKDEHFLLERTMKLYKTEKASASSVP